MSNSKITPATRALLTTYGKARQIETRLRQELNAAEAAVHKAHTKALAAYRRARPDLSDRDAEFVLDCVSESLADEAIAAEK